MNVITYALSPYHESENVTIMALSEGIKRGTVELLILTLLKDQDMYGYQLSQELVNRSNGLYTLQESSMYPTLYRLVEKGISNLLYIYYIINIYECNYFI